MKIEIQFKLCIFGAKIQITLKTQTFCIHSDEVGMWSTSRGPSPNDDDSQRGRETQFLAAASEAAAAFGLE